VEDNKNRIIKASHRTRQVLILALVGILPMLVLCGASYADFVNPFDILFSKQAIKVMPGQVVTVERKLASLTYPVKFTLTGTLPQGEVEYFAMVGYQTDKIAMAQLASANPFARPETWKPDFFSWHSKDRIVPYKSGMNSLTKVTFDGYQTLLKEHFTKNKIFTLLFAIAPKGKVQKLKLNNVIMVRVNLI